MPGTPIEPETLTVEEMIERHRRAMPPERLTPAQMQARAQGITLEQRVEDKLGMNPDVQRGILWPNPNGSWDPRDWTAPAWPYEAAKALVLPGHVAQGGQYSTDDVLNMSLTVVGGGAAPNAVRGVTRGAALGMPKNRQSRRVDLYDGPREKRPFERDYPNAPETDEAGNLLNDIDGRRLSHGGRTAGRRRLAGEDEAISPTEFDAITTEATGKRAERVPQSSLGRNVGRTRVRKGTREPFDVALSKSLTDQQLVRVYGHEIGHVVDQLAGEIPTKGIRRELDNLYDIQTNPNRNRAGTGTFGPKNRPQDDGYRGDEIQRELMAEAIRGYMTNPGFVKEVAPKTTRAIRKSVYDNEELRKVIRFNANSDPGAAAVLRELMREEERREPESIWNRPA